MPRAALSAGAKLVSAANGFLVARHLRRSGGKCLRAINGGRFASAVARFFASRLACARRCALNDTFGAGEGRTSLL